MSDVEGAKVRRCEGARVRGCEGAKVRRRDECLLTVPAIPAK